MWKIVPQQKPVRKILSAWTNEILKNVVQMDGVIIQKLEQDGRGIRLTVGPIDPKLAKP